MAKYIDADLLRKEIEKRLKNVRDYMNGAGMRYKGPKYFKTQGKESAYDALLNTIDSLQQEQQEVDLEKELRKWRHEHFRGKRDDHYNGEYLERSSQLEIAHRFYELGKNSK